MRTFLRSFLFVCLSLCSTSWAFTTIGTPRLLSSCAITARRQRLWSKQTDDNDNNDNHDEEHPAVLGWPDKYVASGGSPESKDDSRIISNVFEVHEATALERTTLDIDHWPTWTTGDKPKWDVGNKVVDKEMPYGELSYMIQGTLEITPQSTGVPVVIKQGDLVTFPKGFVASWQVLEELTWHYYLY